MKKIENNFTVTGFLGKDAEIREFTNSSVARFPLAVSRQERNAEETNRISAFMNIETWRKNENTGSFDQLTKGTMLTIEGYFRSEEWTDKGGVKHNRIVMVAVKFYPPIEKEDVPEKPIKPVKKARNNSCLIMNKATFWSLCFAHDRINTHHTFISGCCDAKLQMKSSPGNTVILSSA